MENEYGNYLDDDKKLKEYGDKLAELRRNGVNKISELKQDIASLKRNKLIDSAARNARIAEDLRQIAEARVVAAKNKNEISILQKEAVAYANKIAGIYIRSVHDAQNKKIASLAEKYKNDIAAINTDFARRREAIVKSYRGKTALADRTAKKEALSINGYEHKAALFDAHSKYVSDVDRAKAAKNQAYVDRVQKNRSLRNGASRFSENLSLGWQNYVYRFKPSKFFLNNGLYLAILVFFVVCIIVAPVSGNGQLLTLPNIFTILEQASVRMFYALGVAGLILIAGTDLSIGRMVALGHHRSYFASGKKYRNVFSSRPVGFYAASRSGAARPCPRHIDRALRFIQLLCGRVYRKAPNPSVYFDACDAAHHLRSSLFRHERYSCRFERCGH